MPPLQTLAADSGRTRSIAAEPQEEQDFLLAFAIGTAHGAAASQAKCHELRAQNGQLQLQVAALQALGMLSHTVLRALDGDMDEGKRHLGPAPRDPLPSDAAVASMGLVEAAATLRVHIAVARVAVILCRRLADLTMPSGSAQAAAKGGAIEAVVAAMRVHPQVAGVQDQGCRLLRNVCHGSDAAGPARTQRAADAGALELVEAAMRANPHATRGVRMSV